jgi:hypothetical protein
MLEVMLSKGATMKTQGKANEGVLKSSRLFSVRLRGSKKGKSRRAKRKGNALQRRQGTDLSGHRVLKSQSGKRAE